MRRVGSVGAIIALGLMLAVAAPSASAGTDALAAGTLAVPNPFGGHNVYSVVAWAGVEDPGGIVTNVYVPVPEVTPHAGQSASWALTCVETDPDSGVLWVAFRQATVGGLVDARMAFYASGAVGFDRRPNPTPERPCGYEEDELRDATAGSVLITPRA